MPPVRSSVFKYYAYTVAVIFLFSKIMPSYSYYNEKKLVYITIITPSSCQPSFYIKCIKLNIHLSCNIKSISNTKCIFVFLYNIYSLSQLLSGNT